MLVSLEDVSFVFFDKVWFNFQFNSINKAMKRFENCVSLSSPQRFPDVLQGEMESKRDQWRLCLQTETYTDLERASNVNSNSKLRLRFKKIQYIPEYHSHDGCLLVKRAWPSLTLDCYCQSWDRQWLLKPASDSHTLPQTQQTKSCGCAFPLCSPELGAWCNLRCFARPDRLLHTFLHSSLANWLMPRNAS